MDNIKERALKDEKYAFCFAFVCLSAWPSTDIFYGHIENKCLCGSLHSIWHNAHMNRNVEFI